MAFIDGLAVRFQDLPLPSSSDLVDVINGLAVRSQDLSPPSSSDLVDVLLGQRVGVLYPDGFAAGELVGFTGVKETVVEPIVLGETDDDKKTIAFHIYTNTGLPASGAWPEGAVCVPSVSQVQTNRDLAGYVNQLGTFTHIGDASYRYTFATSEVAAGDEGNIWLRVKVPGFRTVVLRVPLRIAAPSATVIRDAVLNAARSGYITTGTVGEGVAVAVALLQGNFYMDTVTNTVNGQTVSRMRCFHTGAAAGAATPGGSGEGEFATFVVTTTYTGPNKVATHRVVQQ